MGRVEALRKEGKRGSSALFKLKSNSSRMLITILIGNNVINIGASAIATVLATKHLGSIGPGVAVGVLTILILIFGEIAPKSLATRYSERISLTTAPIMLFIMQILLPLVWLFSLFTSWLQKRAGTDEDPTVTESELISMAEFGEEEGTIETGEREMIQRVFNFNDLTAADVMTPRHKVFRLDGRRVLSEALDEIIAEPYSRIPLYTENPDEIQRVLYLREVLRGVAANEMDKTLLEMADEALFTPPNRPLDELSNILRHEKRHQAIVVDEHGALSGVVTMEDMLEELVGEIYDESDEKPEELIELREGRVLVEGSAELRLIKSFFDIELPRKSTDTVNRWILEHTTGRIPAIEERFDLDGIEVLVQEASSSKIKYVILQRATVPEVESEETPPVETNADVAGQP